MNLSEDQIRELLDNLEGKDTAEVKKVKFLPFDESGQIAPEFDYGLLQDLETEMSVELANTVMTLREILALSEGHLISLKKIAGEPVDISINGELLGKGEVVIINEVFGIRMGNFATKNDS